MATSREIIAHHLNVAPAEVEQCRYNKQRMYSGGPSWFVRIGFSIATCDWTMKEAATAIKRGGKLRIEWDHVDGDVWVDDPPATARPAPAGTNEGEA